MKTTPTAPRPLFPGKTPVFIAFAAILILGFSSVRAATYIWNGTAGDGFWATANNWSSSTVPGSADTAEFQNAGNGNTTIDIGSGLVVTSLLFDNSTSSLVSYTIGVGGAGNETFALNANNSNITVNTGATTDELINANVLLGNSTITGRGTYTIKNNGSANLTIAGNISTQGAAGSGAVTLQINGTGNTSISGVISNGSPFTIALLFAGNASVGGGTTTLSGANSFTSGTSIQAGTVLVANSGALGTGTVTVGNSTSTGTASLLTNGGGYTVANTVQTAASATNSSLVIGGAQTSGTSAYGGPVNLYSAATFYQAAGGETDFTGAVSGSVALTINGGGIVKLTAASTGYTGNLTVQGGSLVLGSGASIGAKGYSIANGATFDASALSSYSFAGLSSGLAFHVGATTAGQFVGPASGSLRLGGALTLYFDTASLNNGQTYTLYTAGGTTSAFSSVTLSGSLSGSLADSAGIWTGTDSTSAYNFTFNESTGVLSVASAIPEPATCAALAGIAALGCAAWRRRRKGAA